MLDLDSSMTEHIFRASGLIDVIMGNGQKMTVSSSIVRAELLTECLVYLDELRILCRTHFPSNIDRFFWIDQYETSIRNLATLGNSQIPTLRHPSDSTCSSCHEEIHLRQQPLPRILITPETCLVFCAECAQRQQEAIEKMMAVRSQLEERFGTIFI